MINRIASHAITTHDPSCASILLESFECLSLFHSLGRVPAEHQGQPVAVKCLYIDSTNFVKFHTILLRMFVRYNDFVFSYRSSTMPLAVL